MEGRKLPLTITEEMAKEDPFYDLSFKKGKDLGLEAVDEDLTIIIYKYICN